MNAIDCNVSAVKGRSPPVYGVVFVLCLCCVCVVFVFCLCCVCVVFVLVLCCICVVFVLCLYCFCVVFVLCLCCVCIVFVLCCVCVVFVLFLCCVCFLHWQRVTVSQSVHTAAVGSVANGNGTTACSYCCCLDATDRHDARCIGVSSAQLKLYIISIYCSLQGHRSFRGEILSSDTAYFNS